MLSGAQVCRLQQRLLVFSPLLHRLETMKDPEPLTVLAGSPEIVQHGVKQREGSDKVSQSRRGGASLLPLSAQRDARRVGVSAPRADVM